MGRPDGDIKETYTAQSHLKSGNRQACLLQLPGVVVVVRVVLQDVLQEALQQGQFGPAAAGRGDGARASGGCLD